MKNIIIVLIVLSLIGGGYYFYSKNINTKSSENINEILSEPGQADEIELSSNEDNCYICDFIEDTVDKEKCLERFECKKVDYEF